MQNTPKKKTLKKVLFFLLLLFLIIIVGFVSYFLTVYYSVNLDESTFTSSEMSLTVLDSSGNKVDLNELSNNTLDIAEISQNAINAFVATEDKRFYQHNGVDYIRIGGAVVSNLKAGYAKEGGSTITQQLIKNTRVGADKTIERKIKEIRLAKEVEKNYSKDEIMELYLNNIYFGNGIYGIDNAAKNIFGKSAAELSISEGATLAGIVKNPSKNSPLNSLDNAKNRRNIVLGLMLEQNYIDESQHSTAIAEDIIVTPLDKSIPDTLPYIKEVISESAEILGISENELLKSNYVIKTYLDHDLLQNSLVATQIGGLPDNDLYSLVVDNKTGGIVSYYSNFSHSVFALRRQVGSVVKPFFAYIPAMEIVGYSPCSAVLDEKTSFGDYNPQNYNDVYRGKITLKQAVGVSSNMVALGLASEVGVKNARQSAANCGISLAETDNTLPIAIGGMSYGLTGTEVAGAYSTIARGGRFIKPSFIQEISDDFSVVYRNTNTENQVFSSASAYLMTDMLKYTAEFGTASQLKNCSVAAKTGTVGGKGYNSDAVCAAYNQDYTYVAHLFNLSGNKDSMLDTQVTGGTYPTLIIKSIIENSPIVSANFAVPDDVVEVEIDSLSLARDNVMLLASPNTPEEYRQTEMFNEKFAPTTITKEYDVIPPDDYIVELFGGAPRITFSANKHNKYTLLRNGIIIDEFCDYEGEYAYTDHTLPIGYQEYTLQVTNAYNIQTSCNKGVYLTFNDHRRWFLFH